MSRSSTPSPTAAWIERLRRRDALIDFMDTMFDEMESGIDPSLLDCSIEPLLDA